MKRSEPRVVFVTKAGKRVFVTFIHTDNFTVRAEVTADQTPGHVNAIRESDDKWVVLDDNLDRLTLFDGSLRGHLPQILLEQIYQDYLNENFTT